MGELDNYNQDKTDQTGHGVRKAMKTTSLDVVESVAWDWRSRRVAAVTLLWRRRGRLLVLLRVTATVCFRQVGQHSAIEHSCRKETYSPAAGNLGTRRRRRDADRDPSADDPWAEVRG